MSTMAASKSSSSTLATSVASQDDPTVQFTNLEELFQAIDCVSGDCLVVKGVSHAAYQEIERTPRKFRFHYRANIGILIVTVPTQTHEALHKGIYNALQLELFRRGIESSWYDIGASTYRGRGNDRDDRGEGDSAGGPYPERASLGCWPTLVVEAGFSQSLTRLRARKDWWFSASDHQVKIVLLVKFGHQGRPEILIEKWEEEPRETRQGATTTRYAAALQSRLRQSITITRDTAMNTVSYQVARGALVLSFRLLFLRNPSIQEGGDIIITVPQLVEFAQRTWQLVPE
ncbi:hypothetical protein BR93DRAFT_536597 [Coniochaeta sp. PMI_546]|nr:hypothetical protein BR93DRAFT_536597 [Coniochaeta sp. PMI_546]